MKYLITQELLTKLQNLAMPRALAEELDELKPIEPMSGAEIAETSTFIYIYNKGSDAQFARAIEAHIIGEK